MSEEHRPPTTTQLPVIVATAAVTLSLALTLGVLTGRLTPSAERDGSAEASPPPTAITEAAAGSAIAPPSLALDETTEPDTSDPSTDTPGVRWSGTPEEEDRDDDDDDDDDEDEDEDEHRFERRRTHLARTWEDGDDD